MANLKPSDFLEHASFMGSVFQNSEIEQIFSKVLKILKRTGNVWRSLKANEYVDERIKDKETDLGGGFGNEELPLFETVQPYTTSALNCARFSPSCEELYFKSQSKN